MSAPTAEHAATTPATPTTGTAPGVISGTARSIEHFLRELSEVAGSVAFSSIASNAQRAAALGFTSSANCSYAAFVEAFRATHPLVEAYQQRYPACCFLPWEAFHKLRHALKLSFDLPRHYVAGVPDHALEWMELFELQPQDHLILVAYEAGLATNFRRDLRALLRLLEVERSPLEGDIRPQAVRGLEPALEELRQSFFVLAPPAAFNQGLDWIQRTREHLQIVQPNFRPPVNDPLVVRVVDGGVLVVAAWGDEAAALNAATAALQTGIPLG